MPKQQRQQRQRPSRHDEGSDLTVLWIMLGISSGVFFGAPLLYFGRHMIHNGIRFSLDHISYAGETLFRASSVSSSTSPAVLVVVTTFLGILVIHTVASFSVSSLQTTNKGEVINSDRHRNIFWWWLVSETKKNEDDPGKMAAADNHDVNDDSDDNMHTEVCMQKEEKLEEYPFLLSEEKRLVISKKVLPASLMGYKWKRVYSVARDGDSFSTCEASLAGQRRTLFVIQTSSSKIIGAYCDTEWKLSRPAAFEGGAGTCLFRFHNVHDSNVSSPSSAVVNVFQWTGENRLIAVFDKHKKRIAFGGGQGSFGLCIDSNFTRGSTASCPTFGNPPLCGDDEDSFHVLDMEIYGFLTVCRKDSRVLQL